MTLTCAATISSSCRFTPGPNVARKVVSGDPAPIEPADLLAPAGHSERRRGPIAADAFCRWQSTSPSPRFHPPIPLRLADLIRLGQSAYLIAAVIFGVGLLIGAIVHVSLPTKLVQQSDHHKASNLQSPIPDSLVRSPPASPACSIASGRSRVSPPPGADRKVGHGRGAGGEGGSNSLTSRNSHLSSHPSEIIDHRSVIRLGDRLALRSGLPRNHLRHRRPRHSPRSGHLRNRIDLSAAIWPSANSPPGWNRSQKSEVRDQGRQIRNQISEML